MHIGACVICVRTWHSYVVSLDLCVYNRRATWYLDIIKTLHIRPSNYNDSEKRLIPYGYGRSRLPSIGNFRSFLTDNSPITHCFLRQYFSFILRPFADIGCSRYYCQNFISSGVDYCTSVQCWWVGLPISNWYRDIQKWAVRLSITATDHQAFRNV